MRPVSRTRGNTASDGGVSVGNEAILVSLEGAPVSGTSGSFVDVAGKGSLLTDVTNAKLYINTGTMSSPTWTVVGTQS